MTADSSGVRVISDPQQKENDNEQDEEKMGVRLGARTGGRGFAAGMLEAIEAVVRLITENASGMI